MYRACLSALAVLILVRPAWAIVTSDQPGSHAIAPGQQAFGLNLDGVAMVGGAPPFGPPISVCTGALISDRGKTEDFDKLPTLRAGLNRVEDVRRDLPGVEFLVADFDSGLAANNALAIFGLESDLGFGADEVSTARGDSGGPLFIGSAIAGVNAFAARLPIADVNGITDSSWGEGNFFTRVSYFRNFILTATGGTAVFVPEPSTIALLIAGVLGICQLAKNRC